MYPSGHPSLQPAAAAVVARAEQLLADRPQIAFGVARRQLIIEGVATNPAQLVLRRLAEGLHRHHLGAVSILRGVTPDEVGEALRALSREPEQHGPLGLEPDEVYRSWPHLRLHPLSFGGLALVGDAALTNRKTGESNDTRSVELWIGLARAAMAGETENAAPETEPTAVARAIDEHPPVEAYDQVVIGYLLQIARELRTSAGPEAQALQRRTARLISSLNPETLRRLVEMSGDLAQRRQFVLDAAHGMAVDSVIEIVKAAADASGQPISDGLVRMLSKLAAHAEWGPTKRDRQPMWRCANRSDNCSNGWELADPNPGRLRQAAPASGHDLEAAQSEAGAVTVEHRPDPVRMVQISLESGDTGPMITRAVDRAIAEGQVPTLLALAAPEAVTRPTPAEHSSRGWRGPKQCGCCSSGAGGLREPRSAAAGAAIRVRRGAARCARRLGGPDHAAEAAGPADRAAARDRAVARGDARRRALVRTAEHAGAVRTARQAARRAALVRAAAHPDVRVRQEAVRLQLRMPCGREAAVRAALDCGASWPGACRTGSASSSIARRTWWIASVQSPPIAPARRPCACSRPGAGPVQRSRGRWRRCWRWPTAGDAARASRLAPIPGHGRGAARPCRRVALRRARRSAAPAGGGIGRSRRPPGRFARKHPMSDPARFLNALGHALAVMTLYPAEHPSREGADRRGVPGARRPLLGARSRRRSPSSRTKWCSAASGCAS